MSSAFAKNVALKFAARHAFFAYNSARIVTLQMKFIGYLLTGAILSVLAIPASAGSGAPPRAVISVKALRIPLRQAAPDGLQALLVKPAGQGPFPLVVLTHGKAATPAQNKAQRPENLLPQAEEFVRRGWAVGIVMRRGYGESGGRFAENMYSCQFPDYLHAAREAARDLRAAIGYLSQQPQIDATRVIAVGASMGGLAVTALTADPPPGLIAAINFAGLMGNVAPDTVCQPGTLLSTFWVLGKKIAVANALGVHGKRSLHTSAPGPAVLPGVHAGRRQRPLHHGASIW